MNAIFGILFPVLVVVLLVLLASGVYGLQRSRLTLASVVHAYSVVVLGVCLVLALAGVALVVKSVSGSMFGLDFSYKTTDYRVPEPPLGARMPARPSAMERATAQARDDLASGISLIVIGGAVGAIHAFARTVAARRDTAFAVTIARGFSVAMLLVSAAVGLASSAVLLDALLRRYIVTGASPDPYNEPRPGGALGFALAFLPLWAVFGRRVWRLLTAGGDPATPDGAPSEPVS